MRSSLPIHWLRAEILFLTIGFLAVAGEALAQSQTSQVRGRVSDEGGGPLQGVQVVAQSTQHLWRVSDVTGAVGDYVLRAMPAGVYVVTFSHDDRVPTHSLLHVPGGTVMMHSVVLKPAAVRSDAVVVEGDTRRPLDVADSGFTITSGELRRLPRSDSLRSAWSLLPGAVTVREASGRVTIDGALVETVRFDKAPALDLSASALQEVTTWPALQPLGSAGLSSDRVAVTTRPGSRLLHGSILAGLGAAGAPTDLVWEGDQNRRAFGELSATFGGPVVTGRTFFHGSVRRSSYEELAGHPAFTALSPVAHDARSWFGRLTHLAAADHRIEALWSYGRWDVATPSGDAPELWTDEWTAARSPRQHLASLSYAGLVGRRRSVELRLTHERWSSNGADDVGDVPTTVAFADPLSGLTWTPACAGCPGSERRATSFRGVGRQNVRTQHDMGVALEVSGATRQSRVEMLNLFVPFARRDGVVAVVGGGEPVWWQPGESNGELGTVSLAGNDVWRIDDSWTVDLGMRWDRRRFLSSAGSSLVWNTFSPSVGVAWTPVSRPGWAVRTSYARERRPLTSWFDAPLASQLFAYTGSSLAIDEGETSAAEAAGKVLEWFRSESRPPPLVDFEEALASRSGNAHAVDGSTWAFGVDRSAGALTVRADLFVRRFPATVVLGALTADDAVAGHGLDSEELQDTAERSLDVRVHAMHRLGLQIEYGMAYAFHRPVGEGQTPLTDQLALSLARGSSPEAKWAAGGGEFDASPRHRFQTWLSTRVIENEALGVLGVNMVVQYDTSARYGARGWVDSQLADGRSIRVPYWFTDHDEFAGRRVMRADVRVSYSRRTGFARAEWFARLDTLNLFDRVGQRTPTPDLLALTAADAPGRLAPFDPFVDVPVRGVHWDLSADPDPDTKFPPTLGRAIRLQLGVEF